jgi:hypothetical protein
MTKISSGLRLLFLVHFIFGLVFGLLYLFIPGTFLGWLNVPVQDALPDRIIGAAVLAFSASSWFCYMNPEWERVKFVILAEIVWTVLNVLVNLYALIFAAAPAANWVSVVLMAGFAAAFIYFYYKK